MNATLRLGEEVVVKVRVLDEDGETTVDISLNDYDNGERAAVGLSLDEFDTIVAFVTQQRFGQEGVVDLGLGLDY